MWWFTFLWSLCTLQTRILYFDKIYTLNDDVLYRCENRNRIGSIVPEISFYKVINNRLQMQQILYQRLIWTHIIKFLTFCYFWFYTMVSFNKLYQCLPKESRKKWVNKFNLVILQVVEYRSSFYPWKKKEIQILKIKTWMN